MDKYHRVNCIGHGIFSEVWKSTAGSQVYAVKITIPLEDGPPHNSRQELAMLQTVSHPNVVPVVDSYQFRAEGDDHQAMVMPYYELNLAQLISKSRKANFPTGWRNCFAVDSALEIIVKLAGALSYLHQQGIIHRDVKPENVMFGPDGPVLVDFGTAWWSQGSAAEPANHKVTDVSTGCYKAPELLFGKADYSDKIDMWSLGCLLYCMVSKTGEDLFAPYTSDIALCLRMFEVLAPQTTQSWPEMSHVDSFINMLVEDHGKWSIEQLGQRGGEPVGRIINGLVTFESQQRWDCAKIVDYISTQGLLK